MQKACAEQPLQAISRGCNLLFVIKISELFTSVKALRHVGIKTNLAANLQPVGIFAI
jgi:hypothetical protein